MRKKIAGTLLDFSGQELAGIIVVGLILGVCPIFGAPTFLCIAAAFALRLNLPALQLINYLAYPIQIALLVPFIRIGGWLLHASPASSPLFSVLTAGLHAVVAWFCVCVPAGLILYVVLAAGLRTYFPERWALTE